MRVLGSYALVYLIDGGGRYQMRGRDAVPCQKGDLLVVFPDIAHAYGPVPGGRWSELYVVFEGEVFDLWRRCGLLSPDRPILRLLPVERHATQLRELLARDRWAEPARQLEQVCLLQRFLAKAVARQAGSSYEEWPGWVTAAIECMEADLSEPIEQIARKVGIPYESFRKKFRGMTGVSPARYRSRVAVDLARKLIYEERLSNKQVAEQLGFCDEFHFSRRFRQATGQSTREFRRSLPKSRFDG